MTDDDKKALVTGLALLILIMLATVPMGEKLHKSWVVEACENHGEFKADNATFKCERSRK